MADSVILHLGYIPTPYTKKAMADPWAGVRSALAKKQHRGTSSAMTAEDIGNILEDKYNILEIFNEIYEGEILDLVEEVFDDTIVEILTESYKFTKDRFGKKLRSRTIKIEKMFREFLNNEEMNGIAVGVPTRASLTGKGRRTKRPGPSFVDTGILRASFRAWVD